ncbi:hypothetical protein LTR08_007877 [Meristemomyces frigidus]|nr:hypothetical protein LTR08_007877 [Meristemomyces frigidus]
MAQAAAHNVYYPGYAASNVKHHEWRTAENSAMHLLPTLQLMAQANPKLTLLDVGAGSGTISLSLAGYMPRGHVTATDVSADILERAAEHAAAAAVPNIVFQSANVYELPFADDSFDIVHASQVLAHLDAPVAALKEMLRVASPGGVVACRESADLHMSFYPKLPGITKFFDVLATTHNAAGGSSTAGTQLVSWAMKAGARREQITATMGAWCYSTPEERQMWGGTMIERLSNGAMRKKALDMNLVTEADLDDIARAWA